MTSTTSRRVLARVSKPFVAGVAIVTLVLSGVAVASAHDSGHSGHVAASESLSPNAHSPHEFHGAFLRSLALHDAMRNLWEQHVLWTRLFIVSDVANLPDLSATTDRLLRNQDDIGNAIKPFYGDEAGSQLTALLRQHILQAATILGDAKASDTAALATDKAAWYANANDIAAFLHGLNPEHWSLEMMQDMMREHLDLTLNEAVDQLTGNYAKSVSDFDSVEQEILGMADTLSSGILAQFGPSAR